MVDEKVIDIREIAATRAKSIQQKTGQLAQLVVNCDPPPGGNNVIPWLVTQVMNMKIGAVMDQVARQAKDGEAKGQERDEAHEAELMKAIESFTLILNTQKPKPKIVTARKMPVMPTSGARQ